MVDILDRITAQVEADIARCQKTREDLKNLTAQWKRRRRHFVAEVN